jgi:hypothetical protein
MGLNLILMGPDPSITKTMTMLAALPEHPHTISKTVNWE